MPAGRFRALLRRSVEYGVAQTGFWRVAAAIHRPPDLVLAYHNIAPDGLPPGGDVSLHLPQPNFRAHLVALLRTHDVVPLAELLGRRDRGSSRPRAALTFDDAYRGAVTCGTDEVARLGLPVTIFVAPGAVGGEPFWWDRLGDGRSGLPEDFRRRALHDLQGDGGRILEAARQEGRAEHPVPVHAWPASESELRAAARCADVTFASHSWSHPNLAALSPDWLSRELSAPLRWLRQRFERVEPCIAYPYGLSSPDVRRAAPAAGYAAALAVSGGALRRAYDPFAVPRLNVPAGLTADGLVLRACGLRRE